MPWRSTNGHAAARTRRASDDSSAALTHSSADREHDRDAEAEPRRTLSGARRSPSASTLHRRSRATRATRSGSSRARRSTSASVSRRSACSGDTRRSATSGRSAKTQRDPHADDQSESASPPARGAPSTSTGRKSCSAVRQQRTECRRRARRRARRRCKPHHRRLHDVDREHLPARRAEAAQDRRRCRSSA